MPLPKAPEKTLTIPTPRTDHVSYEHVYEPAEDSFLLLDALEEQLALLKDKTTICLEVGSGSGIISTAIASALPQCFVLACDINEKACDATRQTAIVNSVQHQIQVVHLDVLKIMPFRVNLVDLLICNPPYVATDEEEHGSADITAAWAGGSLGRNLTDVVIKSLPRMLTKSGCALFVLEQCNKPENIAEFVKCLGMHSEVLISRRCGREFLSIMKITL